MVWVIIDDGSTDDSPKIIKEAAISNKWILHLRLESEKRDLGLHLSTIMKKGFEYAIDYCKENDYSFDFLGNIDSDLTVEPVFFESLMKELNGNQFLGIVSGGIILTQNNKKLYVEGLPVDEPSGGDMLIKKECFHDCDGMPISYSWDSVLKAKARMAGWSTKRFEYICATESRDVNNAEGYWKGYVKSGKSAHYLNYNPLHVILKSIIIATKRPYFTGLAYLIGYSKALITREIQIDDPQVRNYFWSKTSTSFKKKLGH